jgi:hypothetical protein
METKKLKAAPLAAMATGTAMHVHEVTSRPSTASLSRRDEGDAPVYPTTGLRPNCTPTRSRLCIWRRAGLFSNGGEKDDGAMYVHQVVAARQLSAASAFSPKLCKLPGSLSDAGISGARGVEWPLIGTRPARGFEHRGMWPSPCKLGGVA